MEKNKMENMISSLYSSLRNNVGKAICLGAATVFAAGCSSYVHDTDSIRTKVINLDTTYNSIDDSVPGISGQSALPTMKVSGDTLTYTKDLYNSCLTFKRKDGVKFVFGEENHHEINISRISWEVQMLDGHRIQYDDMIKQVFFNGRLIDHSYHDEKSKSEYLEGVKLFRELRKNFDPDPAISKIIRESM